MSRKRKPVYCSYCGSRTEKLYSPEAAAELFDCSVEKIRRMIKRREIGFRKIGRLVRIPASELDKTGEYFKSIHR